MTQILLARRVRGWAAPGRLVVTPTTARRGAARGMSATEILIDRGLLGDSVLRMLLRETVPCIETAAAPRIWINSYPVHELTLDEARAIAAGGIL